ncbi:hypothetical protein G7046_g1744 [Stylonectria norvegica]|nr:hypothetical protein G7046_g1744 [Stylonectria norvegica]
MPLLLSESQLECRPTITTTTATLRQTLFDSIDLFVPHTHNANTTGRIWTCPPTQLPQALKPKPKPQAQAQSPASQASEVQAQSPAPQAQAQYPAQIQVQPQPGSEAFSGPLVKPLKRVPLGRLETTPDGRLIASREPTLRPIPSYDYQNLAGLIDMLYHYRDNHPQLLGQQLDEIRGALIRPSAARTTDHPRLSMPVVDSDESSSEPDLSVLGMARAGVATDQGPNVITYGHDEEDEEDEEFEEEEEGDDEVLSNEEYEAEDTSVEEEQAEEEEPEAAMLIDPATAGLKEISNLGKFTVSSHKPGSGVEELKSDDLKMFWQSDGPQPHRLTVYFVKRVGIRDIRFYVDYNEDESYTPTKIVFKSGTSENNLIEFATMTMDSPVGWQQVPIAGAGGDPDGNTLVSYVLQLQILENHQNGKDTHLRGIKIYAFDADSAQAAGRENNPVDDVVGLVKNAVDRNTQRGGGQRLSSVRAQGGAPRFEPGHGGLTIPDFMREPEIR